MRRESERASCWGIFFFTRDNAGLVRAVGLRILMTSIIKPKALRPGDAIGVVAPAGPVNREKMERALARVQERGFRLKTYGDIYRSRGYLAGDDATRAAE